MLLCVLRMLEGHVLLPYSPVGATVSNKSLADFSICSILGLENDVTQSSPSSGKLEHSLHRSIQTSLRSSRVYK